MFRGTPYSRPTATLRPTGIFRPTATIAAMVTDTPITTATAIMGPAVPRRTVCSSGRSLAESSVIIAVSSVTTRGGGRLGAQEWVGCWVLSWTGTADPMPTNRRRP
jgi:hypothetical protein